MADSVTFELDARDVLRAFGQAVGAIGSRLKANSLVTANSVAREARGRIARRTGKTAAGITVEETHDRTGYVVLTKVTGSRWKGLPRALEEGTRYMSARPYLHASARLEEGPHERRAEAAINAGIAAIGLGD